jgi:hypothetical protein
MRFGYSLTFPVRDEHWFRKIILPACWLFVPLLGMISVFGWACEVCRRAADAQTEELPALDFRRNISDGIRICALLILYGLPLIAAVALGGALASPLFLSEKDAAAAGVASALCAIECGLLLIALADGLLVSAAIGRYASGESFRAALAPGESLRLLRSAPGAYLLALLAAIPLGLLALSGGLICLVGSFVTGVYASASAFHLIGQAHRIASLNRNRPAVAAGGNKPQGLHETFFPPGS